MNGSATASRYPPPLLCMPGLTIYLIPSPIPPSFLLKFPFLSSQVSDISKGLPWGIRHNEVVSACGKTLLFSHGFSFFWFPVRSAGESFCISCQNCASATRPQCSLHTDLIPQPRAGPSPLLLSLHHSSIPFLFFQHEGSVGCVSALFHCERLKKGLYLSVVCHDDQFDILGSLLSMPFMLEEK